MISSLPTKQPRKLLGGEESRYQQEGEYRQELISLLLPHDQPQGLTVGEEKGSLRLQDSVGLQGLDLKQE
jgi:hypothetical protein